MSKSTSTATPGSVIGAISTCFVNPPTTHCSSIEIRDGQTVTIFPPEPHKIYQPNESDAPYTLGLYTALPGNGGGALAWPPNLTPNHLAYEPNPDHPNSSAIESMPLSLCFDGSMQISEVSKNSGDQSQINPRHRRFTYGGLTFDFLGPEESVNVGGSVAVDGIVLEARGQETEQ